MSPPQMFLMNLSHDFSQIPVWFPLMDVSAAVNERNLKPSTLLDKILLAHSAIIEATLRKF